MKITAWSWTQENDGKKNKQSEDVHTTTNIRWLLMNTWKWTESTTSMYLLLLLSRIIELIINNSVTKPNKLKKMNVVSKHKTKKNIQIIHWVHHLNKQTPKGLCIEGLPKFFYQKGHIYNDNWNSTRNNEWLLMKTIIISNITTNIRKPKNK